MNKEKLKEKNKKIKKRDKIEEGYSKKQIDDMVDNAVEMIEKIQDKGEEVERDPIEIKASKPISQVKKGDKLNIDGDKYEVDAQYILIDHGSTKEMAIDIFNSDDRDFQLRYFSDQVETTLELYGLEEIMYFKKQMKKIEW